MNRHLPLILFLLPLSLAICLPLIGMKHREWCRPFVITILIGMVLISIANLVGVLQSGTIHYAFGD